MSSQVVKKETQVPTNPPAAQEYWLAPEVDIYETKEGYTIVAEMPGVNKAGLDVTVEDNELTLSGSRQSAPLPGDGLHREIRAVNFRRTFELDPAIDPAKISARMDQGVLTLVLPKAEKAKPRRISVDG